MRTEMSPVAHDGIEGLTNVTVNGAALAYREQGEGNPVVFVHGSASDLRNWTDQLPVISRTHRAIVYSRRHARRTRTFRRTSTIRWPRTSTT